MSYTETTCPTRVMVTGSPTTGVSWSHSRPLVPNPTPPSNAALLRGLGEATRRWCRSYLQSTGRRQLESRDWDAFGHCWMGVEFTRYHGPILHWAATWSYEIARELGYDEARRGRHDSFSQDTHNEAVGRRLAYQHGTASSLSDAAYRSGQLNLTAPITNRIYTLADGFTTRPRSR